MDIIVSKSKRGKGVARTRVQWAQVVEAFERSGERASVFCHRTGVSPSSLSQWRKRLARERLAALVPPPRSHLIRYQGVFKPLGALSPPPDQNFRLSPKNPLALSGQDRQKYLPPTEIFRHLRAFNSYART